MKFVKLASAAAGALVLAMGAGMARADVVNFDEFTSPPVTCCYSDTGVSGTLVYSHITVSAPGGDGGFVMDGSGWAEMQTSGRNLYGTEGGNIIFTFNTNVTNLSFDMINGTSANNFDVRFFDDAHTQIAQHIYFVDSFETAGGVFHLDVADTGFHSISINGGSDFAVDTIKFDSGAVPEPATWALMIGGFGLAGVSLRRRKAVAA